MASVEIATQIDVSAAIENSSRALRAAPTTKPAPPAATYRKQLSQSLDAKQPRDASPPDPPQAANPPAAAAPKGKGEQSSKHKAAGARQLSKASVQVPDDVPAKDNAGIDDVQTAEATVATSVETLDVPSLESPQPKNPDDHPKMPRGLQQLLDDMSRGISVAPVVATVAVDNTEAPNPPAGLFADSSAVEPSVDLPATVFLASADVATDDPAPSASQLPADPQNKPGLIDNSLAALPAITTTLAPATPAATSAVDATDDKSSRIAPVTDVAPPKAARPAAPVLQAPQQAQIQPAPASNSVNVNENAPPKPLPLGAGSKRTEKLGATAKSTVDPESGVSQGPPATDDAVTGTAPASTQKLPPAVAGTDIQDQPADSTSDADTPDDSRNANRTSGAETAPLGRGPAKADFAGTSRALNVARSEFADQLANAIKTAGQDGRVMRIRLNPPDLGALQIEVALRDGGVSARLDVQTAAAQHAILDSLSQLRDALAHHGTRIDRIDVQITPIVHEDVHPDFADDGRGGHYGQQHSQGDARGDGERSGEEETQRPPIEEDQRLDKRHAYADRLDVDV